MADEQNKDLIEDFLGQMSTYIKKTVEEMKGSGSSGGGEGNGPASPPVKETATPEPPKEKKKHFWFGEVE